MYGWIWRHLPGGTSLRLVQTLLLLAAAAALLLFVVFPYLEPLLPQNPITAPGTVSR